QFEITVQDRARYATITTRRKDHQIGLRRHVGVWEAPAAEILGIVAQRPIPQTNRTLTVIIDLNPIVILSKIILQGASITGHELRYAHLRYQDIAEKQKRHPHKDWPCSHRTMLHCALSFSETMLRR